MGSLDISMDHDGWSGHIDGSMMGDLDILMDRMIVCMEKIWKVHVSAFDLHFQICALAE